MATPISMENIITLKRAEDILLDGTPDMVTVGTSLKALIDAFAATYPETHEWRLRGADDANLIPGVDAAGNVVHELAVDADPPKNPAFVAP